MFDKRVNLNLYYDYNKNFDPRIDVLDMLGLWGTDHT